MGRVGAAILLSLILGLLAPDLLQAEVWRCPGPGGTDLFTNTLKDPATCRPYVPATELNSAPSPPDAPLLPEAPTEQPSQSEPQRQYPEPYLQPGTSYYPGPSYYPGYYYYGSPSVYWFFSRPRFFPFRTHPHVRAHPHVPQVRSFQAPFTPPMNSTPGRSPRAPSSRRR